jgi:hypothetical protein
MVTDIEKENKHWSSVSIGNLFLKMEGSSFIQNVGTSQTTWCHLLIVATVRASYLTKQIELGLITISTVSRMRSITECYLLFLTSFDVEIPHIVSHNR